MSPEYLPGISEGSRVSMRRGAEERRDERKRVIWERGRVWGRNGDTKGNNGVGMGKKRLCGEM